MTITVMLDWIFFSRSLSPIPISYDAQFNIFKRAIHILSSFLFFALFRRGTLEWDKIGFFLFRFLLLPVSEHFRAVFSIIFESIQNFCIVVAIWFLPIALTLALALLPSFITKWHRRYFFFFTDNFVDFLHLSLICDPKLYTLQCFSILLLIFSRTLRAKDASTNLRCLFRTVVYFLLETFNWKTFFTN